MNVPNREMPKGMEDGTAADAAAAAVPRHVAIIMDGNGRWAKSRGLPRFEGHRRGVEAVRRTVEAAGELGIEALTIYSFSSENWSRPAAEIADLMGLMKRFIRNDLATLHAKNVRIRIIGERHPNDGEVSALLDEAEQVTQANTGLTLAVAFNYGSRSEITRAAQRLAAEVEAGRLSAADITDGPARPRTRHRRPAAARSRHPHQRRTAPVEFPALAGRLCRAGVHAGALAGLRPRRAGTGARGISAPRSALRRDRGGDALMGTSSAPISCRASLPHCCSAR